MSTYSKPVTPAEVQRMLEHYANGHSLRGVARLVGRHESVVGRIITPAMRRDKSSKLIDACAIDDTLEQKKWRKACREMDRAFCERMMEVHP